LLTSAFSFPTSPLSPAQFRRVANVFFLGIAILQFFPKFSTISPGLVILPLLAVLAITGAKDGYEDIKRHQSDRAVNHSCTHVLSGSSYTNNNPMGSKSKTFVKGVKLPQSKKKKEKRRLENEMWGTVVRDDEAEVAGENGEQINRFPGEDLRGIRTREDEIEDGNMPRTAEDDPEDVGTDEKELGWKKTMWEDVKVGDFVKIYNNEGFPAGESFSITLALSRSRGSS
jgi:phospholipid-translocating ATPase